MQLIKMQLGLQEVLCSRFVEDRETSQGVN